MGDTNKEYNVKVIHSYHQGLEWTDNISKGILSVFNDKEDVNLFFEYLYTKTFPGQEYAEDYIDYQRKKSKMNPVDVIIVVDNAAYNFMQRFGAELYPDVPIVFCGVNNLDVKQLVNFPNFVGIGEKADHDGTIKSIQKIFPSRKNVLVINDNSLTGRAIRSELDPLIKKYEGRLNFEFLSDFTLKSIRKKVAGLGKSYVIYLLVVNRDKHGEFISYRNGIKNIHEATTVPIFGSWDFYKGKGLFGGKILDAFEQGVYVANMASDIIRGSSLNNFEKARYLPSKYIFDYKELRRFNVSQNKLPENSYVINEPDGLKNILVVTVAIALLLLVTLIVLALMVRRKRIRAIYLEREVNARTMELRRTNDQLSHLIEGRNKFITILGHDLRNSMNNMMTSTFLLDTCQKDEDSQQGIVETQKKLRQIVQQTYNLLEDLLYWGMRQLKDKQELVISKLELKQMLQMILDSYKVNSNNVSLELVMDGDLYLHSDAEICQFIIRNIVQNAVKFSPESGIVRVVAYKEGLQLFIEIVDCGVGMSQEVIDSIYSKNPIKQTGSNLKTSTGIGLSNALEYLELLNGKLTIESEPGKGALFRIQLPYLNA